MAKHLIRFCDSFQVTSDKSTATNLKESFASIHGSNRSLIVSMAATYAGLKTLNNGFYLPEKVKKATSSWVEPYKKPVQRHHNDSADPIGRVVSAEYVDTTGLTQNPIWLNNHADAWKKEASFDDRLKSIDELIDSGILDDPGYRGVGFINLVCRVTDQDAIEKILDGRYSTVSAGMSTNKAVCSKCKQNWAEEGRCEHTPGKDGSFLIAGDLVYNEISFVNNPAIPFASVIQISNSSNTFDSIKLDSVIDKLPVISAYFFGADSNSFILLSKPQDNLLEMRDSIDGLVNIIDAVKKDFSDALSIKTHADQKMLIEAHDRLHMMYDYAYMPRKEGEIGTSIHKATLDELKLHEKLHVEARAAEVEGSLVLGPLDSTLEPANRPKGYSDVGMEDKKAVTTPVTPDLANVVVDSKSPETTPEEKIAPPTVPGTQPVVNATKVEFNLDDVISAAIDGKITDEQSEFLYEEMAKELDPSVMQDAKLSAAARKKLSSSTFCGPGKSFPVPDCAHVTAARRLIGRYKGPGDKSKILSCVARKAKAMGCGGSKDEVSVENMALVKDQISKVDFSSADKETLLFVATEARRLLAEKHALDISSCDECQKNLDEVVRLETELGEAKDQISKLDTEMDISNKEVKSLEDALIQSTTARVALKAKLLTVSELLSGEIKDSKILPEREKELSVKDEKALDELLVNTERKIDTTKIVDKLNNGLANDRPTGTVENPIASASSVTRPIDAKTLAKVEENYMTLLWSKGREIAESYRARMIKEGVLPSGK